MKKNGLDLKTVYPLLYSIHDTADWSLCIGAGISQPIFPSWSKLVEDLYVKVIGSNTHAIETISDAYNLDGVIQAIYILSGKSYKEFIMDLSEVLYQNLQQYFNQKEWKSFCKFLFARIPSSLSAYDWSVVDAKLPLLPKTNAFEIASIISETIKTDLEPYSVLTFNAEPFLYACTNYFIHKRKLAGNGLGDKRYLDFITSSISRTNKIRLPFYYCHGLMPVYINGKQINHKVCFDDKLVFLEDEYLNQTNMAFSWQSSSFCETARSSKVVFIGVSLTDPNMRRWLSWIQGGREKDIKHYTKTDCPSSYHIWINVKPASTDEANLIEALVAKLGIRVLWIDNWQQVPIALRKLLNM